MVFVDKGVGAWFEMLLPMMKNVASWNQWSALTNGRFCWIDSFFELVLMFFAALILGETCLVIHWLLTWNNKRRVSWRCKPVKHVFTPCISPYSSATPAGFSNIANTGYSQTAVLESSCRKLLCFSTKHRTLSVRYPRRFSPSQCLINPSCFETERTCLKFESFVSRQSSFLVSAASTLIMISWAFAASRRATGWILATSYVSKIS